MAMDAASCRDRVILVCGPGTAGKSSLAKDLLRTGIVGAVVSCDQFRFGEGWVKKPVDEFVASAREAIAQACGSCKPKLVAVDTIVYDSPDDGSGTLARRLCTDGWVRWVVLLTMDGHRMAKGVMTRSLRRAAGKEEQSPAGVETPDSVLRLLDRASSFDAVILPKIHAFRDFALGAGVKVLCRPAVPLPEPWDVEGMPSPWPAHAVEAVAGSLV